VRESRHVIYAIACGGMAVYGMILALPGTVVGLPRFTAQFGLSLADRGIFIASLFGSLLVGSAVSGVIVDHTGYRVAMAGSALAFVLLLPSFALASSYPLALAALAGLGFAAAPLNTAANALASELFPEERGRRMTGLAIAFGIGGLSMPAAAAFVSWRAVVIGGAVVSAAIAQRALIAGRTDGRREAPSLASARQFLQQKRFVWFCLLLVCDAANETAFAGWTSSYLAASGLSARVAALGLSLHWFGLVAGRAIFAARVDRNKRAAIVRGGLSGAGILLVMIVFPIPPVLVAGPFAAGVAIGVVLATSLALAGDRYPGNPGSLFGLLLTMAQVGGIVLPPLIGVVAEMTGLRLAMSLLVLNGAAIAGLAWLAGPQVESRSLV
jgi:fucose permease